MIFNKKSIKHISLFCLTAFLLLHVSSVCAQQISEYELKSSYLFNFKKFVDWPTNVKTVPFTIIIYDNPVFGSVIERLAKGLNAKEQKWIIKQVSKPDEITNCNLLYITNKKNSEIVKILQTLEGKPILTVSDDLENFCELGGMINFTPRSAERRLEINNLSAKIVKIKISSDLLDIAHVTEK